MKFTTLKLLVVSSFFLFGAQMTHYLGNPIFAREPEKVSVCKKLQDSLCLLTQLGEYWLMRDMVKNECF